MNVKIEESWHRVLAQEFDATYFEILSRFVHHAYASGPCYPPGPLIFEAFRRTPFDRVKVVILGQDPYHGPGQAHGLCFSVPDGVTPPPSLVNIFKELQTEYGRPALPSRGNLSSWADQGVLLLNSTLTVAGGQPGSHQGKGWETLTDAAISALSAGREHLVFILWGSYAGQKGRIIDRRRHLVLTAPHPSPLSAHRGFFGCGHFVRANQYLEQHGVSPIDWFIDG